MFISYKYKRSMTKDGKYCWEYELTDSEFGTVLGAMELSKNSSLPEVAVIEEYSKRNLNVAANLMRVFIWMHKEYPDSSIQEMIDDRKKYNPRFAQYEEDLQKYLILL
jgi:hypothetical protein